MNETRYYVNARGCTIRATVGTAEEHPTLFWARAEHGLGLLGYARCSWLWWRLTSAWSRLFMRGRISRTFIAGEDS